MATIEESGGWVRVRERMETLLSAQFFSESLKLLKKSLLIKKKKSHYLGKLPVCLFITISPFASRYFMSKATLVTFPPKMIQSLKSLGSFQVDIALLLFLNLPHSIYYWILPMNSPRPLLLLRPLWFIHLLPWTRNSHYSKPGLLWGLLGWSCYL